jgi:hypothetical protein
VSTLTRSQCDRDSSARVLGVRVVPEALFAVSNVNCETQAEL